MLKKPITFTDWNGELKVEEHWFNLTMAECLELQLSKTGGWSDRMIEYVENGNMDELVKVMKDVIKRAYGVRGPDESFLKSEEISAAFTTTEAYSALFMEVITDAEKSAEFVNGVMPADLVAKAAKASKLDAQAAMTAPSITEQIRDARVEEAPLSRNVFEQGGRAKRQVMTKEEILAKMKAKSWSGKELTQEDVVGMTQAELEDALEAGATLPGF